MNETRRRVADEFYVGYLPMPSGHRRFLRTLLPALTLAGALAGAMLALAQRHPGPAVWETRRPVTLRGVLRTQPYPMVEVEPSDASSADVVLLVEQGKHGAQPRAAVVGEGRCVQASGARLRRGPREMLELLPAPDALAPIALPGTPPRAEEVIGPVTLRGEIVDAKCYLGAMKPGDGKAHKACATLCLQGGIPAAFVASDGEWYLLADESGAGARDDAIALVGEPVEVSGVAHRRGRLLILRVPAGAPRRR